MAITDNSQAPGRPWTVVGTHSDFETADRHASQYRSTSGTQVKVKRVAAGFTVRTRADEVKPEKRVSAPIIEERPTFEEPVSKKTKLKAKDRRAKQQRRSDSDEFDDE